MSLLPLLGLEDMKSKKHIEIIHAEDSYDSLCEEIMSFWKENKKFELICEATGMLKGRIFIPLGIAIPLSSPELYCKSISIG